MRKRLLAGFIIVATACILCSCENKTPEKQPEAKSEITTQATSKITTQATSEITTQATSEITTQTTIEQTSDIKVGRVDFKVKFDDNGMEYGQMTAYDKNGNKLWESITEKYMAAQLYNSGGIGLWNNIYYYTDDGKVVAVNASTGEKLWSNPDFKGMRSGNADAFVDANGYAYVSGGMGPDLLVVDTTGKTVYYLDNCGLNLVFPVIELVEAGKVKISGYTSTGAEGVVKEKIINIFD